MLEYVWKEREPVVLGVAVGESHTLSLTLVQNNFSVSGQPALLTYTLCTSTASC